MFKINWPRFIDKYRVSFQLIIPYLIFLFLFMIVGFVVYQKTLEMVQQEAIKANYSLLEQSKQTLDQQLSDIDQITQQMYTDNKLAPLQNVSAPFKGPNTYKVIETKKELMNIPLYNQFILNYYILYNKSDIVLSHDTAYEMPKFYDNVLQHKNQNYEEWRKEWIEHFYVREVLPAREVNFFNRKLEVVVYLKSIGVPGLNQGVIAVLIDNEQFQRLLSGVDISDGGSAYIMDENGQVISSISTTDKPITPIAKNELRGTSGVIEPGEESPMFVTYTTSSYNGWTYVAAQPKQVVLGKVNYMKSIFFTVFYISLAVGIVLAYILAYRSSKSLQAIVQQISRLFEEGGKPKGNLYWFIRDTFVSIMASHTQLEDRIREQQPLLRTAFFERLLKGEVRTQAETEAIMHHIGIELTGSRYAVVLFQLIGYGKVFNQPILNELDINRIQMKSLLQDQLNDMGHLHDVAEDKIVMILVFREVEEKHSEERLQLLLDHAYQYIQNDLSINVIVAAGTLLSSISDISRSYEEAKQSLHYKQWANETGVITYHELPQETNLHYFPPQTQMKLIHCAAAGDEAGVRRIFLELGEANLVQKRLPLSVLSLLLFEIWGVLLKTGAHVGYERQLNEDYPTTTKALQHVAELEIWLEKVMDAFIQICHYVNEHKKSSNLELLDNILQIVQTSFLDSNLSLESVADKMDISRVYLSQFFKEQTGVNFSDYLEQQRMEHARELLRTTELTVQEVADQAGYNSLNTFGRAFKRIHGLSPSAYRQSPDSGRNFS